MHHNARTATLLFLVVLLLGLLLRSAAAFQQPQPAVTQPSETSAVKTQGREADALVMRVRALRFLDRDKEALDVAGTASADVKAQLTRYIESTEQERGAQWAVENAQQTIKHYPSVPANVSSARLVLGEYAASAQARTEAIRFAERVISTLGGDERTNNLNLASDYADRAVASSATGNRIGSQRDFQTALELCRKADCQAVSEAHIYFRRALSSFLLGDLPPAGDDCRAFLQFGRVYGGPSRQHDAEEMCGYILSNTSIQATGGTTAGTGGNESDSIRSEIEQIVRSGKYSPLPPIRSGGSNASPMRMALCEIKNDTAYTLTALFSGPHCCPAKIFHQPGTPAESVS